MFGLWPLGMISFFPIAVMLALSFFVLAVLENVKQQNIIIFGRIVAAFLWIAILLTFLTNVYGAISYQRVAEQKRKRAQMPYMKEGEMQSQMHEEASEGRL